VRSVVGSFWEGKDDEDSQRSNNCSSNVVYVSPVVVDGDKPGNNDSPSDTARESRSI
jgi:hypothetical protein